MNRRISQPPSHKIKVTLLSDDKLVMEGWEQALKRAADIETHKHFDKPAGKDPGIIAPIPDILLIEAAWLKRDGRGKWISALKLRFGTKIIAVYKDRRHLSRRRHILDEAIQAGFNRQELINLIRGLRRDDKSLCNYYDRRLKRLAGANPVGEYAELTANILQLVFAKDLANPQVKHPQAGQEDGAAYVIFENRSQHPFWAKLKRKFDMEYVVFSIQNDPVRIRSQFGGLGAYLSEPFGKVGFLINRAPSASGHVELQTASYRNDGNIILPLFDQTVHNLLASKAAGAEPTDLVEDIFQELFVAIGGMKK